VPHLDPGWRPALGLAALLVVASVLLRRHRRTSLGLREASLVASLYAAWCLVGMLTHPHVDGATRRGRELFRFEQRLHLPSEVSVQQLVLPHPWLAHLVNSYYLFGHVNVIGVLLAWTWLRHREAYPAVRLQLVLLTLVAIAFDVVTIAPPRLLPDLGFVDLASRYGESVYGGFGDGLPGQLLAMPSLHVGWAALVAWTVWRNADGRWRWLGIAHLVTMTFVVVASANHWWLDGIVAVALLAVVVLAVDRVPRLLRARRPEPLAEPALVAASA
jgi:hypothetical protein